MSSCFGGVAGGLEGRWLFDGRRRRVQSRGKQHRVNGGEKKDATSRHGTMALGQYRVVLRALGRAKTWENGVGRAQSSFKSVGMGGYQRRIPGYQDAIR